ncbi:hypothetical protein [Nocardia stercoris]|nr:hypothetical protein [Nocardia stercoris]
MADKGRWGKRRPETGVAVEGLFTMPMSVRAAQLIAVAMAIIGVFCTAAAGWLFGSHSALLTAGGFVPAWLLGCLALVFGGIGEMVRMAGVWLAMIQLVWTVPSIMAGRPPGWLGPVGALALIVLLTRRSARVWFEPQFR